MESENRRRIEETVVDILRNSDVERMTEFKVMPTASKRLGIDLSEAEHRSAVENFLLLSAAERAEKAVGEAPEKK